MALILKDYLEYFLDGYWYRSAFMNGEQSYFDPIDRCFFRITPSKGEVAQVHWIPVAVIHHADALKVTLRATNNEWLIEKYADLEEFDFCVNVIRDMDELNIEADPNENAAVYIEQRLQKWIDDNNIPNCKVRLKYPHMEVNNNEDFKKYKECVSELRRQEALQEEEFKKALRN